MRNENFYKAELERVIDDLLNENCEDGDFGWCPENLAQNMADAAFLVLKNGWEVQQTIKESGIEL